MKKSNIFGVLALTGLGYYFLSRPKSNIVDNKSKQIVDDVTPTKEETKQAIADEQKKNPETEAGKLFVTVLLKASGAEKFAIGLGAYGGESGLQAQVNDVAQSLIPKLNLGPIPKIVSKAYPKSFKSVDDGYQTVIGYLAMFHKGAKNEPVKKVALDYITKVLKSDKKFGNRIIKVSAAKVK